MRFFLRLLIQIDPYSYLEDLTTHFANSDENVQQSDEKIVLAALADTADTKLTGLALRIVLSDHIGIRHESQPDLLAEAEALFVPPQPKKKLTTKKPQAVKSSAQAKAEKEAAPKKKVAA